MAKQLTLNDRKQIEKGLNGRQSFKQIAGLVGKNCTSISREVRGHLVVERTGACGARFNECAHKYGCQYSGLCDLEECRDSKCRSCRLQLCSKVCPDFERQVCPRLDMPPYVCNGCVDRRKCTLEKHIYKAREAHTEADAVRSESRAGTHLSPAEEKHIVDTVAPLLQKGQAPHHIWAANKDTLMISERTLYNMIDHGPLSSSATDLPQKVSRKPRRKPQSRTYKVDPACKQGRHYEEYQQFIADHSNLHVVQMDTVEGEKGSKVILTLHFVEAQFMLGFLRDRNDARSVKEIFDRLTEQLGVATFRELFPVILTDNGSEFSDPVSLETDPVTGEQRTRIFYCHPNSSFEKGAAEKNHTLMRHVLPKRKSSFRSLTPEKVLLMMNHVNSYLRASRGDVCPFDLFQLLYDPDGTISRTLGLEKIEPNDILLKPALLKQS